MTTNYSPSQRHHSRDHGKGHNGIRRGTSVLSTSFLWVALAVLICHWQVMGVNGQTTAPPDLNNYIDGIGGSATIGSNVTLSPNATMGPSLAPSPETPIPAEDTSAPTAGDSLPAVIATAPPTTEQPTLAPTVAVTTVAPTANTAAPTVGTAEPTTLAPSFMPTPPPTNITTPAPTAATASPTVTVTEAPNTTAPSFAPTAPPTTEAPNTTAPTAASTNATEVPTMMPTMVPTVVITMDNTTMSPSNITNTTTAPSMLPTIAPSGFTTMSPSFAPTKMPMTGSPGTPVASTLYNLEMTLLGLNQIMSPDAILSWKSVTEEHTKTYFAQNQGGLAITNVDTTVMLNFQNVTTPNRQRWLQLRRRGRGRRELQTASVMVTYTQEISYETQDATRDTPETIVQAPFSNTASQEAYVEALKETNNEFVAVTGVSDVTQGSGPTSSPIVAPDDDSGGLSTGAIIGIVVGCVVGVIAILGIGYFVSQRGDDGGYVSTGKTPPSQLDVGNGLGDEVSTLAEPHTNNRASGISNVMSGESIQGYGDQSVATVDYDYSKAYGGGGDTSVSSAGGTFGSQTHANAAGGATLGGSTLGANGGPLDSNYQEGNGNQFRGSSANVREELVDIYAPPGKLGVVIDTPDDGAPVVHAVKDSSVIADKLQVGDKLVAVDDEDVRSMTAIKVSKLISRKSANASRKLSIIRTVVIDE